MAIVIKTFLIFLSFFVTKLSYAQEGIDAAINSALSPISNAIAGTVFPVSYTHLTLPTKA